MPKGQPFVQCRVRPEQRAAIEQAAEREGVNRGEIMRRAIVAYLTSLGYPTELVDDPRQGALEIEGVAQAS